MSSAIARDCDRADDSRVTDLPVAVVDARFSARQSAVGRDLTLCIQYEPQEPGDRSLRHRPKSIMLELDRPRNLADRQAQERRRISRVEFRLRCGESEPGIDQQRNQRYCEPEHGNADARGHKLSFPRRRFRSLMVALPGDNCTAP